MTQASPHVANLTHVANIEGLRNTLNDAAWHRRLFLHLQRGLRSGWLWAGLCLGTLLFDAMVLPLAAGVRAGVLILLILLTGVAIVHTLVLPRHERRRGPGHEAWRLEHWFNLRRNPLLNGLGLAGTARDSDDPLAKALATRSVRRGQDTAAAIRPSEATDRTPAKREMRWVLLVAAAWLLILIVQSRLVGGGMMRLLMPFADHPPFSLTQFDVTHEPTQPKVGQDVTVTAVLTGSQPADGRAELVSGDPADPTKMLDRWVMRKGGDGSHRWTLRRLTEPTTLYVRTADGRSRRFTITPEPLEPKPDEKDKQAQDKRDAAGSDAQQGESGSSGSSGDLASQTRDAIINAEALKLRAEQLQRMARELNDRIARGDVNEQAIRDRVAKMNEQLEQFRQQREALRKLLEQAMQQAGDNPQLMAALQQAMAMLDGMELAACQSCQLPGRAPDDVEVSPGQGMGGYSQWGNLGQWSPQVEAAATHDLEMFQQQSTDLRSALESMLAASSPQAGSEDQADKEPQVVEPRATGHTIEEVTPGEAHRDESDAAARQAPPMYRDLVRRYFQRVAQDQAAQPRESQP